MPWRRGPPLPCPVRGGPTRLSFDERRGSAIRTTPATCCGRIFSRPVPISDATSPAASAPWLYPVSAILVPGHRLSMSRASPLVLATACAFDFP
ncbi:Uncharacterised protein [Mycobacteroides abscessus subsp. abscessus]|nr:Uncharacterised protein [Mycobacteroides abscessus subsp. abscessus]